MLLEEYCGKRVIAPVVEALLEHPGASMALLRLSLVDFDGRVIEPVADELWALEVAQKTVQQRFQPQSLVQEESRWRWPQPMEQDPKPKPRPKPSSGLH
jgi:hypothetical protein